LTEIFKKIKRVAFSETRCRRQSTFLSHLLKVADFNLPHLHLAPSLWVIRSSFAEIFGIRKLLVPGL